MAEPVIIIYTNWRGETSQRTIKPMRIYFGATVWHPKPQWLVEAFDVEKKVMRDFALKDFGHPAPAPKADDVRAAARVLLDQSYFVMKGALEAMELRKDDSIANMLGAALHALVREPYSVG